MNLHTNDDFFHNLVVIFYVYHLHWIAWLIRVYRYKIVIVLNISIWAKNVVYSTGHRWEFVTKAFFFFFFLGGGGGGGGGGGIIRIL